MPDSQPTGPKYTLIQVCGGVTFVLCTLLTVAAICGAFVP